MESKENHCEEQKEESPWQQQQKCKTKTRQPCNNCTASIDRAFQIFSHCQSASFGNEIRRTTTVVRSKNKLVNVQRLQVQLPVCSKNSFFDRTGTIHIGTTTNRRLYTPAVLHALKIFL